jgi:hypothetical protein
VSVNLLTNISNLRGDRSIRNWSDIKNMIPTGNLTEPQLDLAQAHDSTFYKIRFADYHIFILRQLYDPNRKDRGEEMQHWVRAELHSIVYNLYSALDSLGYEINLAYGFGIPAHRIHFDHGHDTKQTRNNCLRCELRKNVIIIGDQLHRYLERSLSDPWFDYFRRLRNQITHKHFPVWNLAISAEGEDAGRMTISLPDNPENMNPGSGDYTQNLELRQYCEATRERVREVLEEVYRIIAPQIRQRYGSP